MEQNRDLSALEQNIGYKFKNINLLKNALTHTSYAYEHKIASNEKLEFLGDSILEFLSSKYIYNNYPNLKEGEMTKVRATVVCEDSLYKIAEKHNFSDFLYVGKSEQMHQGNKKRNRWQQLESMLHTSIHPPQDSLPLPKARNLHREGNRNCLRLPYHPANPGPGIRPHHRQEDKPGRELQHQDKRRCRQEHHPHR